MHQFLILLCKQLRLVREIINATFRELGREFTPEEIEAIDTFRATAQRLQFETLSRARGSELPQQLYSDARSLPI